MLIGSIPIDRQMDEHRETLHELRESKTIDIDSFDRRVSEEGKRLKEHLASGTFDNDQATIGLEYEFYAVDRSSGALRRVPHRLSQCLGFERELGLHNLELTSSVQPCDGPGLLALEHSMAAKLRSTQALAAEAGIRLVSDGMWTVGPATNTTEGYLTEATHDEGISLAINVSNAVRYHGFGSVDEYTPVAATVELPGATIGADTAGPVSLTTSIQPHVQPRQSADLPAYHNAALRIAGPVLALAANSPFLPPSLYDGDGPTRQLLLQETHAETRIPVYEGLMNPADGDPKVRFPADLESLEMAVDRVVNDAVIVPAQIEGGERFDDQFVHLRHKHGSFWRWVRPVFDGPTPDAASARIEFRPLPGQPTLPDTVSLVALVVGLVTELVEGDHPAAALPWETARTNFYHAARDGIVANMTWVTAVGDRTTSIDRIYDDLFSVAISGLDRRGLSATEANTWIEPLRARISTRTTPERWRRDHVEQQLNAGTSPTEAIKCSQQAYISRQADSLYAGSFADWLDG